MKLALSIKKILASIYTFGRGLSGIILYGRSSESSVNNRLLLLQYYYIVVWTKIFYVKRISL